MPIASTATSNARHAARGPRCLLPRERVIEPIPHDVAAVLQRVLLPRLPDVAGPAMATLYQPAGDAGLVDRDFCDWPPLSNGPVPFFVGDRAVASCSARGSRLGRGKPLSFDSRRSWSVRWGDETNLIGRRPDPGGHLISAGRQRRVLGQVGREGRHAATLSSRRAWPEVKVRRSAASVQGVRSWRKAGSCRRDAASRHACVTTRYRRSFRRRIEAQGRRVGGWMVRLISSFVASPCR